MNELLAVYAGLAGVAALIAFLINILKVIGVVKDGQAQNWSVALNLVFLVVLFVTKLISPAFDIQGVDVQVAEFVRVGTIVFAYIVQLLGSKLAHVAVRNVVLIGKSYS